jgi:hypothetical protein
MPSGNGQLSPACLARSKYSPTVLLETLQIRAMARLEKPSFFYRNTSRIFPKDIGTMCALVIAPGTFRSPFA